MKHAVPLKFSNPRSVQNSTETHIELLTSRMHPFFTWICPLSKWLQNISCIMIVNRVNWDFFAKPFYALSTASFKYMGQVVFYSSWQRHFLFAVHSICTRELNCFWFIRDESCYEVDFLEIIFRNQFKSVSLDVNSLTNLRSSENKVQCDSGISRDSRPGPRGLICLFLFLKWRNNFVVDKLFSKPLSTFKYSKKVKNNFLLKTNHTTEFNYHHGSYRVPLAAFQMAIKALIDGENP